MNKTIALVVVGLPLDKHFDYAVPATMQAQVEIGSRVRIVFARRKTVGYVIGFQSKSSFSKISSILEVIDDKPVLDDNDLALARQLRDYYGCSLGEAIEAGLSPHLKRGRKGLIYTRDKVSTKKPKHALIYGLNDSDKKWKSFNDVLTKKIKAGQSVLILLPEKFLIEQTVGRIDADLTQFIVSMDRKLKSAELDAYAERLSGKKPIILIGMRSCVFSRINNLGLIVVLDEASSSYKEEQSPHYHAREVVFMRSEQESIDTLWISLLPSVELWYWAQERDWKITHIDDGVLGQVKVIDMMNYNPEKRLSLSAPVQNDIKKTLETNGQIAIIVNQRDFVPFKESEEVPAKRSKVERLTYLVECMNEGVKVSYFGPGQRCSKKAHVIIATPTVLKEKWFSPDLIVIANFDTMVSPFDFRASHKAFQFVTQLKLLNVKVVVQTFMADHFIVKALRAKFYQNYYQEELKHRFELGYPPFNHIITYSSRANDEEKLNGYMSDVYAALYRQKANDLEMIEPFADHSARLKEDFRYTIMLKSKEVRPTVDFLKKEIKQVKKPARFKATIDVDPY